ncbi:MAG: hypothetical protein IPQ08_05915 [Chitinophagaceae bacterium]|nr:hypothetical protein [Chitinophagaceae bacterium]
MKLSFKRISIDVAEKSIKEKVNSILNEPELMNSIGDAIIKDIRFQTRRGVSSINGERFKPTSKAWRNKREKIAEATSTNDAYSKNRSNLTLTGQLLDSLRKAVNGKSVKIFFAGVHMPYKQKYLEYFMRKKSKRRINLGRTVEGFQTSAGGISYVNTGKTGTYTVGKAITNNKLAEYVEKGGRPFFGIRAKMIDQLKSIVIRYIRRKL